MVTHQWRGTPGERISKRPTNVKIPAVKVFKIAQLIPRMPKQRTQAVLARMLFGQGGLCQDRDVPYQRSQGEGDEAIS